MEDLDLMLMAYADGELAPEQVAEVEALIAAEPGLNDPVDQHRRTTAVLRAACADAFYAGTALSLPSPHRQPALRTYAGWAIAATVAGILGFGGGTFWSGGMTSARDRLVAEVADYHAIFSHESDHLVEIPASRSTELTAWLGSRVGRTIAAPDLTEMGLTFAGGRMLVVEGKPVAELMYTRANGLPIALCVAETDAAPTNDPDALRIDRRDELTLASWQTGKHTFVVVGAADPKTIGNIARQSRTQIAG